MNGNIRRYLSYAVGEVVLVIVGIVIALQIGAWNEDRKIREDLNDQLHTVAENISQDLISIDRLKRHRTDAIFASTRLADLIGEPQYAHIWYTKELVQFASMVIAASQQTVYFAASSGAYREFESAGYANHIAENNLKSNLHDYYATVERITFSEREMNSFIRDVTLKYQTDTTQGFFKPFLREPLLAWVYSEVDEEFSLGFQESYLELLNDAVTQTLVRSSRDQTLMLEYEHLLSLGAVLVVQINAFIADDRQQVRGAGALHGSDIGIGPSDVFENGRFAAHSLGQFTAPSQASFGRVVQDLRMENNHLRVNYRGGDEWAFLYVRVGHIEISVQKEALDYSRFDRIQLDLNRHSGCENLRLILKDVEDSDDGSQANVQLELADDWTTVEYDLSLFEDANLEKLNVVAGFLMDASPCSFSIRNVSYLEPV